MRLLCRFTDTAFLLTLLAGMPIGLPCPVRAEQPAKIAPIEEKRIITSADRPTTPGSRRSPLRQNLTDPLAVRTFDPRVDPLPDCSLSDFSVLLEAPAGGHGFLRMGSGGRLQFSDGTTARFWGVRIAAHDMTVTDDTIATAADVLARAGCNLVRFEGLAAPVLTAVPTSTSSDTLPLSPELVDRLDSWVFHLKQNGIYSCLVLGSTQTPNRETTGTRAIPASVPGFDPEAFERHKAFGRELLTVHRNQRTRLTYAADPSVALIEVLPANSTLEAAGAWTQLPAAERLALQTQWIDYLRRSYGTDEKLRRAWTNAAGECALAADESLHVGNIALPVSATALSFEESQRQPYGDPKCSPVRRRDAVRFVVELVRRRCSELRRTLSDAGVKAPLGSGVPFWSLPESFAVSQEMPYASCVAGDSSNVDSLTAGEWLSLGRWRGKPGVAVARTDYSLLELAVTGRLQEYDAIIAGSFTPSAGLGQVNDRDGPFPGSPRWREFGAAAVAFLGQQGPGSALRLVEIGYSGEDLACWSRWSDGLRKLALSHRVANALIAEGRKSNADLLVQSGRSHVVGYDGQYGLIFSNAEWLSAAQHARADGKKTLWARSGYSLPQVSPGDPVFRFGGIGFDDDSTTRVPGASAFAYDDVRDARLEAIGVSRDKSMCLGGYDELRKNLVFGRIPPVTVARFAFDLTHHWYDTPMDHHRLDRGQYVSDTGEILQDEERGLLTVDSDSMQFVECLKPALNGVDTPSGRLQVEGGLGDARAFLALSLDGHPLRRSRYFMLKCLDRVGCEDASPTSTCTVERLQAGEKPALSLSLAGRLLLRMYRATAAWELLVDLDARRTYLACDSPQAQFVISMEGRSAGWPDDRGVPKEERTGNGSYSPICVPSADAYVMTRF